IAAGCVAVPLNAHDRAIALARQVEHCAASALLGDPAHKEWGDLSRRLSEEVGVIPVATRDEGESVAIFEQDLGASGGPDGHSELQPDRLAVILYTSGTTGRPKGVMLSQRNLLSNALAIARYLELGEEDRGLCVLPFHFSYGSSVLN